MIIGLLLANWTGAADKGVEVIRAADKLGGNRHALIIGINDYTDPKIPDLKFAEVDAQSLYKTLTDPQVGGFKPENTTLLLGKQANTREIKKALSGLRGVGANDLVVVYFSGHGAKQRGETCWVTQDAELNYLADTALSNDQIAKYLGAIPSKRLVVLLDACYAADTVINQKAVVSVDSLAGAFDGAGRVTIASAGGGQEAIEAPDLQQGVFTHFLVQGLRGEADKPPYGNLDGVMTLSELWSYLSDKVTQEARKRQGIQVPTKHALAETQTDKFLLTINAPFLATLARQQQASQAQVKARVDALKKLLADDKINADQFTEGRRVLEALEQDLKEDDRQRRTIYTDLTEGRLHPNYLQAALDKVETPAQREARMAREAELRAQRDRSARIAALLKTAKANDNKENGRTALAALEELLKLDPGHAEAQRLRAKIAAYYGASRDAPWTNSLGMKFVPVKGTDVLFSIWDTRVQDFDAFVRASGYDAANAATNMFSLREDGWKQRGDTWKSPGFTQGATHPVVGVSWEDAKAFCKWLTEKERAAGRLTAGQEYRLPTDAEWSMAVGLGPETGSTPAEKSRKVADVYPWGTQWPPPQGAGNYCGEEAKQGLLTSWKVIDGYNDGYPRTSPVGSFAVNQFGLFDMGGNVWQWCEDLYQSDKEYRVLRGASWGLNDPDLLLSSYRIYDLPGNRFGINGFRCVVVVASSSQ